MHTHSRRKVPRGSIVLLVLVALMMFAVFQVGSLYGYRRCSRVNLGSLPLPEKNEAKQEVIGFAPQSDLPVIKNTPQMIVNERETLPTDRNDGDRTRPAYAQELEQVTFDDAHLFSYGNHSNAEINAYLVRRAKPSPHASQPATLFLVPVNEGYLDFGLNLMCSLLNVSRRTELSDVKDESPVDAQHKGAFGGFVFIAMDEPAHQQLSTMRLPVIRDPDVPFITSKSAAWADPKFHSLVCTKLIPVLRALRQGLRVVLTDADIVYLSNPIPYFRRDTSLTFSIGSCHKDLADNFHFTAEGIEKLNTGFYVAHPTDAVLKLFASALEVCRSTSLTGDQPAINSIIQRDWNSGLLSSKEAGSSSYSYSFFDGCLFANGCVYFKHLCENTTKYPAHAQKWMSSALLQTPRNGPPTLVHANFLVGKKNKIKHLGKYGLWDTACVAHFRRRLSL